MKKITILLLLLIQIVTNCSGIRNVDLKKSKIETESNAKENIEQKTTFEKENFDLKNKLTQSKKKEDSLSRKIKEIELNHLLEINKIKSSIFSNISIKGVDGFVELSDGLNSYKFKGNDKTEINSSSSKKEDISKSKDNLFSKSKDTELLRVQKNYENLEKNNNILFEKNKLKDSKTSSLQKELKDLKSNLDKNSKRKSPSFAWYVLSFFLGFCSFFLIQYKFKIL